MAVREPETGCAGTKFRGSLDVWRINIDTDPPGPVRDANDGHKNISVF
jgi:hypothetical protein